MIIKKVKAQAQEPIIPTEGSVFFDIKACLDEGERLSCYNSLNKETKIPVKKFKNVPGIQIYPAQRFLIPTGLTFDIPEGYIVKLYNNFNTSLKKGLNLINGIQIIEPGDDTHLEIAMVTTTDAVAVLQSGDVIASGCIEKSFHYVQND